jgi:hypothetical protein
MSLQNLINSLVSVLLLLCFGLGYQVIDLVIKSNDNRAEHNLIYGRLDYLEKPQDAKE